MLLTIIGFAIGTIGTLIGAGGGFLMIPILLHLYPGTPPSRITGLSMIVVALNASSGSLAYLLRKRVHLRAAFVFIAASLPGAILGVSLGKTLDRRSFELIFGAAMMAYATYLLLRKAAEKSQQELDHRSALSKQAYFRGSLVSFFVGFLASFLGIGGGIVHVPLLSHVLGFPVHIATSTSHFILAATAWVSSIEHLRAGDISLFEPMVLQLGGGVLVGAQFGAVLSNRVSGRMILKLLAVALWIVGIRLVLRAF